ncbi:MAG: hypothetical protein JNM21_07930 [Taibaiella sp.]|nr:hypothetical protein [Taibaiella sp.]
MNQRILILSLCYLLFLQGGESYAQNIDIYQDVFEIPAIKPATERFEGAVTIASVETYIDRLKKSEYNKVIEALAAYKSEQQLSDWMYYQVVRRTANYLSPKVKNYNDYTLLKWLLMRETGYDVRLAVIDNKLLFYTRSEDEIYDIPYFNLDNRRYVCLNRHDFESIPFATQELLSVPMPRAEHSLASFSYKIAQLPEFTEDNFSNRFLDFSFRGKAYHFNIRVNNALDTLFTNYPVVNYEAYFNIPMSKTTYNTLMPELKHAVADMSRQDGVAYLMEFTRNAFAYESDLDAIGKEQRNAPELTLLRDKSDCDDRVALLYFFIKEIYDLPMVVVQYPSHVLLGVSLDGVKGFEIPYKGRQYIVVDPTPQSVPLKIGEIGKKYKKQAYEIAYAYKP